MNLKLVWSSHPSWERWSKPNSPTDALVVCNALVELSTHISGEAIRVLSAAAGPSSVVSILQLIVNQHGHDPGIICAVCRVIYALASFASWDDVLLDLHPGSGSLLLFALTKHGDHADVISEALRALCFLVPVKSSPYSSSFEAFLPLVVRALREHLSNATLTQFACAALARLFKTVQISRLQLAHEVVPLLLSALSNHAQNAAVAGSALRAHSPLYRNGRRIFLLSWLLA